MAQTETGPPAESHDLLDHLWGWSQVGGALVGLVALTVAAVSVWYAKKAGDAADSSAHSAERTAKAAEETAMIAREELQMLKDQARRRPVIELKSVDVHPLSRHRRSAVLQLGLFNSGNASTEGGWINLLVPPGTVIAPCANERGEGAQVVPLQTSPEALLGTSSCEYLTAPAVLIEGMATVAFYRLDFPSPGRFSIRVKLGATRTETVVADAVVSVP